MKFTNRNGLPQALCDAVTNDPYDNGGSWRSVTQLIAPPRQVILKQQYDEQIVEDISDRLYALYGQIVHQILERANTQDLVEERLFATVRGRLISGGFDVLQLNTGHLTDWKFSTVWKAVGDIDEWVAQVNLLALLFRFQGVDIQAVSICLLMRDHSKPRARREEGYPQLPVKRIPIKLWTREEQERYLNERVQLHLEAEDKLPECSAAERWARPDIYAVMKKGNKNAIRGGVHEDRKVAEELVKLDSDRYLEIRPGESIRCLDYCSAAMFCTQFQKECEHVGTTKAGSPG